jgi:aromatic ring-cleaving dioxygenase
METELYELLHNRGLRQTLLQKPQLFSEDFQVLEFDKLRRSANQQLLQTHRELKDLFPQIFLDWQKRFPFDQGDQKGIELSAIFQESKEYDEARYLTQDQTQKNVAQSFLKFCENFWHLVKDRPAHLNKEVFNESLNFHVHMYEETQNQLRGPHPQDMRMVGLNFLDLKHRMSEFLERATIDKPILIHTSTNDDLYDHTYGAIWLGRTLPLNFSKLD